MAVVEDPDRADGDINMEAEPEAPKYGTVRTHTVKKTMERLQRRWS